MSNAKVTSINKGKSFAEEGLEDVLAEASQAEASIPAGEQAAQGADDGEGELQQVSGREPIALYYRTSVPKKAPKTPYKVLAKGDTLLGRYEKKFVNEKYGQTTYIIRTENGLVGINAPSSLKRGMEKLAEGSKVKIIYEGMGTMKSGAFAGRDAHNFTVFGNKFKAQ